MKQLARVISILAFGGLAVLATGTASATPVHSVLSNAAAYQPQAMPASRNTPGWNRDDVYGRSHGMDRYAAGDYKEAMKYFLIGARYADKLSQLSIGLMYLHGDGVEKNPATAFAWIAIASERKSPQILSTRDALWARLDAQQRQQATAEIGKLYVEYGDTTAQRRLANELRWNESALNGPLLGFQAGR